MFKVVSVTSKSKINSCYFKKPKFTSLEQTKRVLNQGSYTVTYCQILTRHKHQSNLKSISKQLTNKISETWIQSRSYIRKDLSSKISKTEKLNIITHQYKLNLVHILNSYHIYSKLHNSPHFNTRHTHPTRVVTPSLIVKY